MANKTTRRHHGLQECDYNLDDFKHKFSGGPNDKLALVVVQKSVDLNTNFFLCWSQVFEKAIF